MKIFTSKHIVNIDYDDSDTIDEYLSLARILMRRKVISEANKYLILSKKNYSVSNSLEIIYSNRIISSNGKPLSIDWGDQTISGRISRSLFI